jgi:hypothetical protein
MRNLGEQNDIVALVAGYVIGVAVLWVARVPLQLAPDVQFLSAAGAALATAMIGTWQRVGLRELLARERSSRRTALRAVALIGASVATALARQRLGDLWPVVVMVVGVPALAVFLVWSTRLETGPDV